MRLLRYIIVWITIILLFAGYSSADTDLEMERLQLNNIFTQNDQEGLIQGSTPRITVTIRNNGPETLQYDDVGTGFIVCTQAAGQVIFQSSYIGNIFIPVDGFWTRNIQLNPILTETLTEQTITCRVNPNVAATIDPDVNNNELSLSFNVLPIPTNRFDLALGRSIEAIQQNLDPAEAGLGTDGVVNFVRRIVIDLLIPIIIVVGVIVAIIGFYKMMFSDSEEATKEGSKYLIRGTIAIVAMMSAWYLTSTVLFDNILSGGNMQTFSGIQAAQTIYNQAVFPFIKIAMYLAMGVLFVIIAARVLQYLTNPSEEVKKQAVTLIAWNVIGILIILGSKEIVELIFGSEAEVMDQSAQDLGDIGAGVLSGNLPILYTIINWIMGLAAFIILIIIIIQTYQLLVNPTSEETMTKIKRSFLYIAIGILVIGAGYVITNFLIIN